MSAKNRSWQLVAALTASMFVLLPGRVASGQEAKSADPDGEQYETLLRGPVHEAFAQPFAADPTAGMVVPKKPPEPVDEAPPDQRPEGNPIWISGYWAWEPDREEFIWVSGVWRQSPPGRRWVPGFWTEVKDGYQWTSGLWASAAASELNYLPEPPRSLEEGPNSPAPSDDYFWVPGCWMYQDQDYRWRPGYWSAFYSDWIWMPCHYVWTPRGCLYVNGYWDYGLYDRGYLFAPVFFGHHHHGFRYRPHFVIGLGSLLHFFTHARHHHYYFGDFYGDRHARHGFRPWHEHHRDRRGFDPLFAHYDHAFRRRGIDYGDRLRGWNEHFRKNEQDRPPRSLAELRDVEKRDGQRAETRHPILARELGEMAGRGGEGRFERLTNDQAETIARDRAQMRDLTESRRRVEKVEGTPGEKPRVGEGQQRSEKQAAEKQRAEKQRFEARPRVTLPAPLQRSDFDEPGRADQSARPGRSFEPRTGGNEPQIQRSRPEIERNEIERRGPQTPQFERSRPQAPQIERSRPSAPRIEERPSAPRTQPSGPRIQQNAPRPQPSAPRIQRSAPRIQQSAPRPSTPRFSSPRPSSPRPSSPSIRGGGRDSRGPSGGGGGGRGSGGRGGGRRG